MASQFRDLGSGVAGAASGNKNWAVGGGEQFEERFECSPIRPNAVERRHVGWCVGSGSDLALHIEWKIQHDGAAFTKGGGERSNGIRDSRIRAVYPFGHCAHAAGEAVLVDGKVDCTAAPAVSAVSTISGVRLLAASVMPVSALVKPHP